MKKKKYENRGNISSGYCSDSSTLNVTITSGHSAGGYGPGSSQTRNLLTHVDRQERSSGIHQSHSQLTKTVVIVSVLQIIVGSLCMTAGVIFLALGHFGVYFGAGFWGGAMFVAAGICGLVSSLKIHSKFTKICFLSVVALALFSLILSLVVATFASIAVAKTFMHGNEDQTGIFHFVSLILAAFETVLSSITSVTVIFILCRKPPRATQKTTATITSTSQSKGQIYYRRSKTASGRSPSGTSSNVSARTPKGPHTPPYTRINHRPGDARGAKASKAQAMPLLSSHKAWSARLPDSSIAENSNEADSSMLVVEDGDIFNLDLSAIPLPVD